MTWEIALTPQQPCTRRRQPGRGGSRDLSDELNHFSVLLLRLVPLRLVRNGNPCCGDVEGLGVPEVSRGQRTASRTLSLFADRAEGVAVT